MDKRTLVMPVENGMTRVWTWDAQSLRSTRQTREAIYQSSLQPGGPTLLQSIEAQCYVQSVSRPEPTGLYGFFMRFFAAGEPAAHDQAIVELTQEIGR